MAGNNNVRDRIYCSIDRERARQEELKAAGKFLYTCADPQMLSADKYLVLAEEVGEVARAVLNMACLATDFQGSLEKTREELVQVAAVAVAWIEGIDRITGLQPGYKPRPGTPPKEVQTGYPTLDIL